MSDLLASPVVQSGAAVLILCVLTVAAFYVVSSYRDYVAEDQEVASDALANLREMHRNGDITDEEFRTIKARTQHLRTGESKNAAAEDVAIATTDADPQNESTDSDR
jgi:hypothetical protein